MNNEQQYLERLRDHKFYLENLCQIKTKEKGLQPFILNEAQKDIFNTMRRHNRIIILKARQLGFSSGIAGFIYVDTIMRPGITSALIGYNSDMVIELLDKIRTFHRTTPEELRPTVHFDSKYEMSFPAMDSKILVLPNTKNVGRGLTLQNCLITELSSWDDAEEKMGGLVEAVPENGRIIVESCVSGDTIVLTDNGPKYVEEIHDWGNNKNGFSEGKLIKIDGHYGLQPTSTYYNSGVQKGFKIITRRGYELKVSSIHKLFVLKGCELKFVEAKDLKIGDLLTIKYGQELWGNEDIVNWNPTPYGYNKKQIKQFNPKIITKDLAYLIGLILGDGSIYKNDKLRVRNVVITNTDYDITNFLLNNELGLKFYQDKGENYYHYRCTNKSFVEFLQNYIGFENGVTARKKKIPKIVLTWKRKNIVAFLQGLFDTDGSCRQDRGEVSFTSTSKQVIYVLQILLLNFGIISRVYEYNAKPSKKVKVWSHGYKLEIGRSHSEIFLEKIGFRVKRKQSNGKICKGSHNCLQEYIPHIGNIIKKQMNEMGLRHSDIRSLNKVFYSKNGNITYRVLNKALKKCKNKDSDKYKKIKVLFDKKYLYDDIKEIIPIEENVYDFTVDNGHTVTYNGFVGHQTPRGAYGLYHRMWMVDNNYIKKDYGWWWGYSKTQMTAKKKEIGRMMYDQEYGLEFLSTGRNVFDVKVIQAHRKNILKVGDINKSKTETQKDFVVREEDGWIIYREPEVDGVYVCGGDAAEGIAGGDYLVATIFDRKTGEEVAMYRGHIPPDRFGDLLDKWGRKYNNALMVVEINNHGLTTMTILKQKIYPNLYFRPSKFETLSMGVTDRLGWRTTQVTRPLLIDEEAKAMRNGDITIHSKKTLDEMSVFIYNDNGDMVPSPGFGDDTIFSVGIALQGFKGVFIGKLTQIDEASHLPKSFSY